MESKRTCPSRTGLPMQRYYVMVKRLSVSLVVLLMVIRPVYGFAYEQSPDNSRDSVMRRTIESIIAGSAKPVEFVYYGEFERERQIVRRIEGLDGIEDIHKDPVGSTPIGISLDDLNSDRIPDILACIHHSAFSKGAECAFHVFFDQGDGEWTQIEAKIALGEIFILSTKHLGFKDLLFQRSCRVYTGACNACFTIKEACRDRRIERFDGGRYSFLFKIDVERDRETDTETISIPIFIVEGLAPGVVDIR